MMPNNVSITVGKKQHTLKNTVMALPNKVIVFLGRTFSGHNHDDLRLKQEFPPELDWFIDINVRVDLGYLGIQSAYSPRSRGLNEHRVFSCAKCCLPAYKPEWGNPWEAEVGKKCLR